MNKLKDFMNILTGSFNNSEQFDKMKLDNIDFPYAEHVNTICNDKIINLPEDFKGIFMVEESYYTSNGNTSPSLHPLLSDPGWPQRSSCGKKVSAHIPFPEPRRQTSARPL